MAIIQYEKAVGTTDEGQPIIRVNGISYVEIEVPDKEDITEEEIEVQIKLLEDSIKRFNTLMASSIAAITEAKKYGNQQVKNQIHFAKESIKDFTVDTKLEYEDVDTVLNYEEDYE